MGQAADSFELRLARLVSEASKLKRERRGVRLGLEEPVVDGGGFKEGPPGQGGKNNAWWWGLNPGELGAEGAEEIDENSIPVEALMQNHPGMFNQMYRQTKGLAHGGANPNPNPNPNPNWTKGLAHGGGANRSKATMEAQFKSMDRDGDGILSKDDEIINANPNPNPSP